MATTPLVFVDIDGVINPTDPKGRLRGRVPGWKTHKVMVENRLWPQSPYTNYDPRPKQMLPLVLNADLHGPWLAGLIARGAEVMWASTWPAEPANRYLAPLLGIEALPSALDHDLESLPDEHVADWKARQLVALAGDRPLVFVDDQLFAGDGDHWSGRHPGRTLLIEPDFRKGLTTEHMASIDAFVDEHLEGTP